MCVAEMESWREEGRLSVTGRQQEAKEKRDKETGQQGRELIYRFTCAQMNPSLGSSSTASCCVSSSA